MKNFGELVNLATKNIRNAVTQDNFDLNELLNDTNYSEICEWCGFPDLGTYRSLYDRAINVALFIIAVENDICLVDLQRLAKTKIVNIWDTKPITEHYETYFRGNEVVCIANDKQVNIPKNIYDAIKANKL